MKSALLIMLISHFSPWGNTMTTVQQIVPNDYCVQLYNNLSQDILAKDNNAYISGGCYLDGIRLPD